MRIFELLCRLKSDPWRKRLAMFQRGSRKLFLRCKLTSCLLGHEEKWTSQQKCLEEGIQSWNIPPRNLGFPREARILLSVVSLKYYRIQNKDLGINIMEIQREVEKGKQEWFQTFWRFSKGWKTLSWSLERRALICVKFRGSSGGSKWLHLFE